MGSCSQSLPMIRWVWRPCSLIPKHIWIDDDDDDDDDDDFRRENLLALFYLIDTSFNRLAIDTITP